MVFSDPRKERLQPNEESLWVGTPTEAWPLDYLKILNQVRELVFANQNAEANAYRYTPPPRPNLSTSLFREFTWMFYDQTSKFKESTPPDRNPESALAGIETTRSAPRLAARQNLFRLSFIHPFIQPPEEHRY